MKKKIGIKKGRKLQSSNYVSDKDRKATVITQPSAFLGEAYARKKRLWT